MSQTNHNASVSCACGTEISVYSPRIDHIRALVDAFIQQHSNHDKPKTETRGDS